MKRRVDIVERRNAPSREEFEERYRAASCPVIMTDEAATWPAVHQWSNDYLTEQFGDCPVSAHIHEDGLYSAHTATQQRTTLGELLASYRTAPKGQALVCHVQTLAPYLIPYISIPSVAEPESVEAAGFWIKPRGAKTGLHFDHQDGFLTVVRGRKRLLLFSPDQYDRLYPCPIDSPKDSIKRNWSSVLDIFNPDDHEAFPMLADAEHYEVILEPGEMLFIPKFWWHAVSHPDELTIGVNFFLAVTYENTWPTFYRDRVFIERLLARR